MASSKARAERAAERPSRTRPAPVRVSRSSRMVRHVWSTVPLALAFLVAACGAPAPSAPPKPDGLIYEDTRRLLRLLARGAAVIERRGAAAFAEFGRPDSPWRR